MSLPSSAAVRAPEGVPGGGGGPGPVVRAANKAALRRAWLPEATYVRPAQVRAHRVVTAGLSSAGRRWPGSDGDDPARITGGSQRRVHSRNTGPTAINPAFGASAGSRRFAGRRGPAGTRQPGSAGR